MITRREFVGGLVGTGFVVGADPSIAAAGTLLSCDVAVIGGVAAALAALSRGRRVIMTEETSMIGGQLTSQLVPPDEHYWIEESAGGYGRTATYADLRRRVRDSYKRHRPVTAAFKANSEPDPGNSWVSRLTAEPLVWRNRMHDMLAPYLGSGQLTILYKHRPTKAAINSAGTAVRKIDVRHVDTNVGIVIDARYYIDATELGDLLPVVGCRHTIGREGNTGELHNPEATPDPLDQQSFTWVAAVGYDADGDYRGAAPASYANHRPAFDAFSSANLFDPTREYAYSDGPNFWQYRRVIARANFTVNIEEVSLLNYPCNDYKGGPLLAVSDTERRQHLAAAKDLTACLLHYLQTDIPRRDGSGHGYPGLRLRPDIAGTTDGYALAPYVREGRRMVSLGRVWEWHVGVDARPLSDRAAQFIDSVGTGHYWLDIHGGPRDPHDLWRPCYTYQIPMMALISPDRINVLAGGKRLGVSHVTNGAYRLHPTEWATGEAAGIIAHCALARGMSPKRIRASASRMRSLRTNLVRQGAQLCWPDEYQQKWRTIKGLR